MTGMGPVYRAAERRARRLSGRSGRRRPTRRLGALLLALALATPLGCLPGRVAAQAARPATGPVGSLVLEGTYEPMSLDPAVDWDSGVTYLGNVYEGLVRATGDRQVTIVPDLATRWEEAPDGRTWTFHLRPHVLFHDGAPVDAAAVKFSFQRLFAGNRGAVSLFTEIQTVEVVDALTVRFHLRYPFASFLASLTSLYGAAIVSPRTAGPHPLGPAGASYLDTHDAGSGPYMLASYDPHQRIVLRAFPGYWRGWRGPHVATVTLRWSGSSGAQRRALEQGSIAAAMNLSAADFAALAREPGIKVIERTAQSIRDVRFNTAKGALRNVRVRQALAAAFDYGGMIQGVFGGHAARMRGVGPMGFANFVPAIHLVTFDLGRARQLLAASGVPARTLSFTIAYLPGDTQAREMAAIFGADLARVGVRTTRQELSITQYAQAITQPATDPDIWIGSWGMDYPDDAELYWTYFYSQNIPPQGGNFFFYKNQQTDQQLLAARAATDPLRAQSLYQQVCQRVYDQAVEIWPMQPTERIALRANVRGYHYNFLYSSLYYPLYDLYLA